jgi:hypothetical protein
VAAFQRAQDKLREERISVAAASVDPRDKAAETIAVAQYSSGPIGRLVWQDVLGLIRLARTSAS